MPTFNGLQVTRFAPRDVRSLEMKWGVVKHDVAKFFNFFSTMDRVKEFDTMFENLVEKALLLYQESRQLVQISHICIVGKFSRRCHFLKVKGGKEDSPMKKMCSILSRWEGENHTVGDETLLVPSLNEHNIEE